MLWLQDNMLQLELQTLQCSNSLSCSIFYNKYRIFYSNYHNTRNHNSLSSLQHGLALAALPPCNKVLFSNKHNFRAYMHYHRRRLTRLGSVDVHWNIHNLLLVLLFVVRHLLLLRRLIVLFIEIRWHNIGVVRRRMLRRWSKARIVERRRSSCWRRTTVFNRIIHILIQRLLLTWRSRRYHDTLVHQSNVIDSLLVENKREESWKPTHFR